MSIKISVVIPAYNSKDLLHQGLLALEKQTAPLSEFEVIVVDDGSTDGTLEMLESLKNSTTLNLNFLHISNSGPATARNSGVAVANSDWIGMLDADVLAHADWVHRILELIELYPEAGGFEGRTLINERHKLTPFTHQTENFYGGRYPTCNMVLRKTLCRFYTKYRIPFREDTDLAFCVLESGYQIKFDPNMKVFHPPLSPSYNRPIKLAYRYYYDGMLRRRFPERYKKDLDTHSFLNIPIPHIKKKLYGVFLLGQISLILSILFSNGSLVFPAFLIFFLTYCLSFWSCVRTTQPQARTRKDMFMLGTVNIAVPWVMYSKLIKGFIDFRHEPRFNAQAWNNREASASSDSENKHEFIVISTADWDHPFWTNKQHIAARLAERGHRVLYVESLGLRQVTASFRDFKRIYRRIKRSLLWGRNVRPNIWVWSPLVLPFHRFALVRQVNWVLLNTCLRLFSKNLNFKDPILWSYNPTISPIAESLKPTLHVYHCVDELKEAPGMPVELLESTEQKYSSSVNIIIATNPILFKERKQWNVNTYYMPNPGDFNHFNQATQGLVLPEALEAIPEPRIGFIGALSNYKVDSDLLHFIASKHPEWSIVLLGQIGEGEPRASFAALLGLKNVHFLGAKPYAELPSFLAGFNAALIPCPINGYTRGMFPLKFFEYLASGIPVISTALPALEDYRDSCHWTESNEDFLKAIESTLENDDKDRIERGLQLARENTWDGRVEAILKVLESHR